MVLKESHKILLIWQKVNLPDQTFNSQTIIMAVAVNFIHCAALLTWHAGLTPGDILV